MADGRVHGLCPRRPFCDRSRRYAQEELFVLQQERGSNSVIVLVLRKEKAPDEGVFLLIDISVRDAGLEPATNRM